MKIAVCLSGLPRTGKCAAPFIKNFFSNGVEVDYFCHTWDVDQYKKPGNFFTAPTYVPTDSLQIISEFNPIDYQIDSLDVVEKLPVNRTSWGGLNTWAHLFYSAMIANHLKRQHEMKHDFRYDIVVKTRYDVVFEPSLKFNPPRLKEKELYTHHLENFEYEFSRKNFSDVTFYGTSRSMDLACDYFRYISFVNMTEEEWLVGPGVGLHQYLSSRNITPHVMNIFEVILRPEALNNLDWDNIRKIHSSYYQGLA